jgi:hypothetical protein
MKKIIGMLVVVAAMVAAVTVKAAEQAVVKEEPVQIAHFPLQHHDIVIEVLRPLRHKNATSDTPVITGCHVKVILSDRFEMVGLPQCHWDGVNEKTRYAFTLNYKLKNSKEVSVTTYSLNLSDFVSMRNRGKAEDGSSYADPIGMGVIPEDGIVNFRTAPVSHITGPGGDDAFSIK